MLIGYLGEPAENGKRYLTRFEVVSSYYHDKKVYDDRIIIDEAIMPSNQVRVLFADCTRFYLVDKFAGKIEEDFDLGWSDELPRILSVPKPSPPATVIPADADLVITGNGYNDRTGKSTVKLLSNTATIDTTTIEYVDGVGGKTAMKLNTTVKNFVGNQLPFYRKALECSPIANPNGYVYGRSTEVDDYEYVAYTTMFWAKNPSGVFNSSILLSGGPRISPLGGTGGGIDISDSNGFSMSHQLTVNDIGSDWHHYAFTKTGGKPKDSKQGDFVMRAFVDGKLIGTKSNASAGYKLTPITFGYLGPGPILLQDIQVWIGKCIHTEDFTPTVL